MNFMELEKWNLGLLLRLLSIAFQNLLELEKEQRNSFLLPEAAIREKTRPENNCVFLDAQQF